MVKVGDKISAQIIVDGDLGLRKQTKTGEVTYVHPKGYWCRVKFHLGGKAYHQECMELVDGKPLPNEGMIIRK